MEILRLTGNQCHCRACGEQFSNPANFDRHRHNGACRSPEAVGLVRVAGAWKRANPRTPQAMARFRGHVEVRP